MIVKLHFLREFFYSVWPSELARTFSGGPTTLEKYKNRAKTTYPAGLRPAIQPGGGVQNWLTFKGAIRKFWNSQRFIFEAYRHPPKLILTPFFRVNVP
jgi:hypothetical protein